MLTTIHIIGILLTVGVLLAVSIASGRKVKDARSFTTGGQAGSWTVCGAILGIGGRAQQATFFGAPVGIDNGAVKGVMAL